MEDSTAMADLSTLIIVAMLVTAVLLRSPIRRVLKMPFGAISVAGFWLLSAVALWFGASAVAASVEPPRAVDPGDPCPTGAPLREFDISLINIPLFLNRFADVVPEGRMYILDDNIQEARDSFADAADPNDPHDIIEPLTVRVNRGDCIEVSFTNRLDEPAPSFDRDDSIFILPGETLLAPGADTSGKRDFAPALTQPHNDFDPENAPDASMHFDGLSYDPTGSDGAAVGNNPNSTVPAGQATTYRLFADVEGQWQFKDGADFSSVQTGAGNFIGSHAFGAFGAVVVEPEGTTWIDARTGGPLESGTRAVIQDPDGPDVREHVIFMHDEVEAEPGVLTRFCVPGGGWNRGNPPSGSPGDSCLTATQAQINLLKAGTLPALSGGDADALIHGEIPVKLEWFAFNYRAEPGFNREEVGCPAGELARLNDAPVPECVGEETSLSSWAYGDPGGGDLVFANYRGEPTQVRLMHPAEFETHTFHWHVNRWPLDPQDEGGLAQVSNPNHHTSTTNILDVQAVSPGDAYGLIAEGGAGSAHDGKRATFGDIIFHCHLYPHFANGMWGLNRTHDVLENGSRTNPDGTPVRALHPLADFDYQPGVSGTNAPPSPTVGDPGYPFFVPGTFGLKAPKPPLGVPSRQTGQPAAPTALEIAAADPGGQVPGGFFQNPCPATRSDGQPTPVKTYYVEAIEIEQVYNPDLDWTNPQSRIYVGGTSPGDLSNRKQAILNGEKPEPFSPLLNVGDCVVYHLTNALPLEFGGNVFDREQITNEVGIHQHMVQFDVLTSDGAANGWNYDQGADANAPNQPDLTGTDTTITYRNFVHADTATNSFHDHFFPNVHQDNGLFGGATIHPAGCDLPAMGTIVDVICEPATDYHGVPTDGEDYRNFSLFIEDHVPMFQPEDPGTTNDNNLVTPFGVPIFPAKYPSSADDYGVMGINYRLEPFENRRNEDPSALFNTLAHSQPGYPRDLFDPHVPGDPYTPLLGAIEGDRIKFRLFQLSQEESHGFNLDRHRWDSEPNDPDSAVVQAQHIGMLEYFDMRVQTDLEGGSLMDLREYQYNLGGSDDWFLGAWGLLRVHTCEWLEPIAYWDPPISPAMLPDNPVEDCHIPPSPMTSDQATRTIQPMAAPSHGDSGACPADNLGNITVPVKEFDVSAINVDLEYNDAGDNDPHGLMYALEDDVDDIRAGLKEPEPLIVRANAGDCIELTLHNELDPELMEPHCHEATEPGQLGFEDGVLTFPDCVDQPPRNEHNVPGFQPYPVSAMVGMRPTLVDFHCESAGYSVGLWNPYPCEDGLAAPGQSVTYYWYAPEEVGLAVFQDRADVQNHQHHGLYGGLVIEPAGSTYLDPDTGDPLESGANAVIVTPNRPDFREHVVLYASDHSLFRSNDQPVPDNLDLALTPSNEADDTEDQGEVSINYRNEPWAPRYQDDQDLSLIFSSTVHGDPATPLFEAYAGDPVVLRVAQAVGKPRSTGFGLHGHVWRRSPNDPESELAAFQGQFNPTVTHNIHLDPALHGGAGGPEEIAGDYLYRTGTLQRHMIGGQWGIFRVHDSEQSGLIELPDRSEPQPPPSGPNERDQQAAPAHATWLRGRE